MDTKNQLKTCVLSNNINLAEKSNPWIAFIDRGYTFSDASPRPAAVLFKPTISF
jgi:hypothetical protein